MRLCEKLAAEEEECEAESTAVSKKFDANREDCEVTYPAWRARHRPAAAFQSAGLDSRAR